ncbi:efflux RND transporter periplasmic adaptor subunit [Jannaschia marina]|uniref:efflux RND transporter periplasmic adaptor subunit n=1 Tax=Jannaschia marina TaxID=2741674 RepID=UPI0015CA9E83|nr:efflux RND transporter periplasmic adaptor subunit [Jannaschia marina]
MSETPRPAKVATVDATEATVRRAYPATVLPSREAALSFRVGGRIVELPIRGAILVGEGDVIAVLDPRDFETEIAQTESQIAQAAAQLDALRAGARPEEIAALEAGVEAAQAQFDAARENVDRTRQLRERGVVANAQLEQAESEFRVAEAQLRTQQEQLRIGQTGGRPEEIAASEAAIDGLKTQLQASRDNLEDATLRAPFAGIIARRDVEPFDNVNPGQPIALLQALDPVHLAFDIPGPDVTSLTRMGTEVIETMATFDAIPDRAFDAEFVEFSVQADEGTRTYRGRAAVPAPEDAFILPGMTAEVVSEAPTEAVRLIVPLTAVAASPDGSAFVWLLGEDGALNRRVIELGDADGAHVVVTDGLEEGEQVVAAGVGRIVEGMTIRPLPEG